MFWYFSPVWLYEEVVNSSYISHRICRSGLPPEGETEELQLELDYTWLQTDTRAGLVNVGEMKQK